MKFDINTKEKISKQREARVKSNYCTKCDNDETILFDSFVSFPLSKEISNNIFLGEPSLPCAVFACTNCGHIDFHSLGLLGITKRNKE